MTCPGTESSELLDGHMVALSRGSQLRVRLADGREIRAIPLLEALEAAECPEALLVNRRMVLKHNVVPQYLTENLGCLIDHRCERYSGYDSFETVMFGMFESEGE